VALLLTTEPNLPLRIGVQPCTSLHGGHRNASALSWGRCPSIHNPPPHIFGYVQQPPRTMRTGIAAASALPAPSRAPPRPASATAAAAAPALGRPAKAQIGSTRARCREATPQRGALRLCSNHLQHPCAAAPLHLPAVSEPRRHGLPAKPRRPRTPKGRDARGICPAATFPRHARLRWCSLRRRHCRGGWGEASKAGGG
jgi:hypothetical protein